MLAYMITVAIVLFFMFLVWSTRGLKVFVKFGHLFLAAFALYEILHLLGKIQGAAAPKEMILLSVVWLFSIGIFSNIFVKFSFIVLGVWGIVVLL